MIKKDKKIFKDSTVDDNEISQFNKISNQWWDESGDFKQLHKLNPPRLTYIKDHICQHFSLDQKKAKPFKKLRIADIGCGGGLITEPLSRLGADVTGIDAGKDNINIARKHAKSQKLDINYKATTAEELVTKKEKFDVVIALEIVEHVADINLFISSCCKLLKKNGILILSTINRTPKSFMLGIVTAEYLLGWVPKGTHDWNKFLKPSEIATILKKNNFEINDLSGITYPPLSQEFKLDKNDIDVNYLLCAVQPIK